MVRSNINQSIDLIDFVSFGPTRANRQSSRTVNTHTNLSMTSNMNAKPHLMCFPVPILVSTHRLRGPYGGAWRGGSLDGTEGTPVFIWAGLPLLVSKNCLFCCLPAAQRRHVT